MVKYLGIIFTLYAKDARQTATKVKRRQVSTWRYLLPIISIYWDFSETLLPHIPQIPRIKTKGDQMMLT